MDYGATPFRLFHSWFSWDGFDKLVSDSWNGMQLEDKNGMVRFKKKLQGLKKAIREWVTDRKKNHNLFIKDTKLKLGDKDKKLDCGEANGEWIVEPIRVKEAFRNHFASQFHHPSSGRSHINFTFPNRLSQEQTKDLENHVFMDEIRKAVWDCGENKFPGCNSSFVALIPKVPDAKFVSDFCPISLIGSSCCLGVKERRNRPCFFKVDFTKAYDSVRWDFLDDVLRSFGFGSKWRLWISGCLSSAMASIIVNGSPTFEFQFQCGLKQGDPPTTYLFILVMESLHLSFSRVIEAGMFKGTMIDNSVMISHLFYVDDAVFVGEWSDSNLDRILQVLQCFYLASGLKINVQKSNLMGVGVNHYDLVEAVAKLGRSILKTPFKYLGVTVESSMSRVRAWEDTLSVLSATSIYAMSLYKVPKTVLNVMESIRNTWMGDQPFKLMFPRIYALESNKLCTVAQKCHPNALDQTFRRSIRGGVESQQYTQLHDLIRALILSNTTDRWVWDLNGSGDFMFDMIDWQQRVILFFETGMPLVEFRLAADQLVYGMVIVAEVDSDGS
ncbi:RNA-directed DNA polymerase, eukaryota [Tanacetum coccineum]